MNHVFHRHTHIHYPLAVGGDGPYVIAADGRRYLDACSGAAVSCLGYSHPRLTAAIQEQAATLAFVHTAHFTNEPMERLADFLVSAAPEGIDRAYFVSGGSEAMESALKMARQYFLEIGQPQRRHFVARRQSYHGNTLGALAVGGNEWRRRQFRPLLIEAHHIAPCYAYRDRQPQESEADYGRRVADELEQKIRELGEDSVIAFLAEPVVGATAGAVPPVPGYFRRIREICDRYGVLLILDEVMCGMGRTGTRFACEQDGVVPDIVAVAKGLGAGYQPIGAALVQKKIYDAIHNGSGFFQHGHTYNGHALACAAALAVQRTVQDDNLLDNVRQRGRQLRAALEERFGDHPQVGDIRGRGLFLGLELVQDRETKKPFDPKVRLNARVKAEGMKRGLMSYPMGGTIDGLNGDHVLIAPPFIIDAGHVEIIVDTLGQALDAAVAGVKS
ncbi:MAG: aspartate aminotransferase family protein [Pseudomonadota bacterium]|nr:aspartate aminotransferase family protein [Pseudomonadota bacterium]